MTSSKNRSIHTFESIQFVALISLALGLTTAARAESLGLSPTGWPDITTFNIITDYVYDAESDTGHLTGYAGIFDPILNNQYYVDNGESVTFNLDVYINSCGDLKENTTSTISITGDMWDYGTEEEPVEEPYIFISGPTLLTANLSQFGFSEAGAQLEFIFEMTGGSLQTPAYFPGPVGLLLHESGFNGDWTQSFSETTALSDLFNVPEPSCWVMFSTLVIGGWMAFRRRTAS